MFKHNPKEFLRRFMTYDETWIHWYRSKIKKQLKQWTSPSEPAPKKAMTVLSVGKVMAIISWNSKGVIYSDFLKKSKTVTGLYNADLLGRFDAELQKRRPHLANKKSTLRS
ncbi:Mariner Mos1 transposase [Eumeta japonica]|uniref:Mariner Mos1 transposase n=1 Tax=Eumeta variegata TaxID=151549 RepID=A0A4C1VNZ4_EUMVA|nr:Mariner Mos1 transposase [Eumeta japonica]